MDPKKLSVFTKRWKVVMLFSIFIYVTLYVALHHERAHATDKLSVEKTSHSSTLRRNLLLTEETNFSTTSSCDVTPITKRQEGHRKCKRISPAEENCNTTRRLFQRAPQGQCSGLFKAEFCKLDIESSIKYHVTCRTQLCKMGFMLGLTDNCTGEIMWTLIMGAVELEDEIAKLVHPSSKFQNFGHCFIRCDDQPKVTQLLLLPPRPVVSSALNSSRTTTEFRKKKNINIEIILIDSLSRDHFYRSLPKTVSKMRSINEKRDTIRKRPIVYDFELFQSIKARTYESFQALFIGDIISGDNFKSDESTYKPLKTEKLFKLFNAENYLSLWLDDLCWKSKWGPAKDFLVANDDFNGPKRWRALLKAFGKAGIHDIGITAASCALLKANGVENPFQNLSEICYNGRHQHQYFFDYLRNFQKLSAEANRPYISFFTCSTSHENTGLRVKTIDNDLAEYVKSAAENTMTLTIIMSDHGNNYGVYPENMARGRYETYNPALFVIIPSEIQKELGELKMEKILQNQNKLVTLIDINRTLKDILRVRDKISFTRSGNALTLWGHISENRTCNDVNLLMPNICICNDAESLVDIKSTEHNILAEFAVGMLNNALRKQFLDGGGRLKSGHQRYGSCSTIRLSAYRNVRLRFNKTSIIYKFDVIVTSEELNELKEIVFVNVEHDMTTSRLVLTSFERMTPYTIFSSCSERNVNIKLCLCNIKEPPETHGGTIGGRQDENHVIRKTKGKETVSVPEQKIINSHIKSKQLKKDFALGGARPIYDVNIPDDLYRSDENFIGNSSCVRVFTNKFINGAAFKLKNKCMLGFKMKFKLKTKNMYVSFVSESTVAVFPYDHMFLGAALQRITHLPWEWSYEANMVE